MVIMIMKYGSLIVPLLELTIITVTSRLCPDYFRLMPDEAR